MRFPIRRVQRYLDPRQRELHSAARLHRAALEKYVGALAERKEHQHKDEVQQHEERVKEAHQIDRTVYCVTCALAGSRVPIHLEIDRHSRIGIADLVDYDPALAPHAQTDMQHFTPDPLEFALCARCREQLQPHIEAQEVKEEGSGL
jgi:hypothetical protein